MLGSVTKQIHQAKSGCGIAINQLWKRYHRRLLIVAAACLGKRQFGIADEQDIVNDAFGSFFIRLREGAFPELANREELWLLLRAITKRKSLTMVRDQTRLKRNIGRQINECRLRFELDAARSRHLKPHHSEAVFAEALLDLLHGLEDPELRAIALARIEGKTNAEIAVELERSVATIERRLRLIRKLLQSQPPCETRHK